MRDLGRRQRQLEKLRAELLSQLKNADKQYRDQLPD